jgi:4-hydroxybutyrate CoA-transferase
VKNDKVVGINSAIQLDLTVQVCADSFGHQVYSRIGGQMDFIHGKTLRERVQLLIGVAHPDFRTVLKHCVAEVRHYQF